jgi:hypothetical protein
MKHLLIYFYLLLSITAFSQSKKVVWDYPIRSGTDEWSKLTNVEEQFKAYNIPDSMLKRMPTAELITTCLNYPEWGLMDAYNERTTGFSVLVSLFNGFQELFIREDAGKELIKLYMKLDPLAVNPVWTPLQIGLYGFQFTKIELLLMQKSIIKNLNKGDMDALSDVAISVYERKKQLPQIYSLWNLSPTVGICLSLIEKKDSGFLKSNYKIQGFKHQIMTNDIGVLDEITNYLKKH